MKKVSERDYSLDFIRVFALLCVISVHFFLNTGFYSISSNSTKMLILTIIRSFFMICVPLFMVLTGYLNNNKKFTKIYCIRILKYIFIYILCSLVIVLYKRFYLLDVSLNFKEIIKQLLSFNISGNAWYVEMYLGLYLIIPFLNKIWKNSNDFEKKSLIFILIILTILPNSFNIFKLNFSWWKLPSSDFTYIKTFPEFWQGIYPITYYYIGCYIYDNKCNYNNKYRYLIIIICTAILFGVFCFYRSYPLIFQWGRWQEYNSLFIVVMTYYVFIFFLGIKFNSKKINSLVMFLSEKVYGAYLCSWILDNYLYRILNNFIPVVENRFCYFLIMVLINFVFSIILSCFVDLLYNHFFDKFIKKMEKRL